MKHGKQVGMFQNEMAAKRSHAVQKELTSFFGFSQSRSKKAKDIFKILPCLDIEIVF